MCFFHEKDMNLGNTEKSTSGHNVGLGQEDFFTVICGDDDDEGVQQQFANSRVRPMFRDVSRLCVKISSFTRLGGWGRRDLYISWEM